ncbi:MAG: aminotransferase class III-fold pyridoxal phosphate-dependent enzyme [Hyphomicrobiales bacterium]|nr:aminotransferase class III-fold pyridoxal phosphate-dependent enzyme [Hyphomicrobiales bacterium]
MTAIKGSTGAMLIERARKVLPGGVSRNTLLSDGPVRYVHHGKGCNVIDVDGVEYIDFANNVAAHIHGHAFEPIVSAVAAQLQRGTAFTMATEAEVRFAEHLCARAPAFDKIRFVNSGTEAVMAGMKAARAFTGRPKIAKVEGSYHGAYDFAEVSQGSSPKNWGEANHPQAVPLANGTPSAIAENMVVLPFNDADAAIAVLDEHRSEIAAIVVDPVPHRIGMIPVSSAFAKTMRDWADSNGALLMFDEVITFRNSYGGVQGELGVIPDLTAMGKMIGGGFPAGALAGSNEVLGGFAQGDKGLRLPLAGTFSANPVTMTAGYVAMSQFDRESVGRLNALGDYARSSIAEAIRAADVPACVCGAGSLLRIHLKEKAPCNYREAYPSPIEKQALGAFIAALYHRGIMLIHTGSAALSTPMGHDEIDRLSDAVHASLVSIRPLLDKPGSAPS